MSSPCIISAWLQIQVKEDGVINRRIRMVRINRQSAPAWVLNVRAKTLPLLLGPLEKYWSSWGGVRILLGRYLYEQSIMYDSVTYRNKSEGIKVSPQGVSDNSCAMKPWSKAKQSGLCSLRRARKETNGLAWWLTAFSAWPLLCLGAKCRKITWFWCAQCCN